VGGAKQGPGAADDVKTMLLPLPRTVAINIIIIYCQHNVYYIAIIIFASLLLLPIHK
jgi:hypothetical protein